MIHYAIVHDGKVIASRSSKSHAQQIYTHAAIVVRPDDRGGPGAISYHSSERLAMDAVRTWAPRFATGDKHGAVAIAPVIATPKRMKVGDRKPLDAAPFADMPESPARDRALERWAKA